MISRAAKLRRYSRGVVRIKAYIVPSSQISDNANDADASQSLIQDKKGQQDSIASEAISPKPELRKLSSLKWPYIPDTANTAFPDPLTRDDPKPLTMAQYEAIGAFS